MLPGEKIINNPNNPKNDKTQLNKDFFVIYVSDAAKTYTKFKMASYDNSSSVS